MRNQHVRLLEHRRVELGVLDSADVNPRLDPVGGIDMRPAVGRAQHHIGPRTASRPESLATTSTPVLPRISWANAARRSAFGL